MHKYKVNEVVVVKSGLLQGVEFGTYNYRDKKYIPEEHFIVTEILGGRELEYRLTTIDGLYSKVILPERLIERSVPNLTIKSDLPTEKIPLNGWCLAPSKRVLGALNDQFGKINRSECGAAGVAWNVSAIWKIEGSSSYTKVENDFLESIYFPDVTVSLGDLVTCVYRSGVYDDRASSVGEILLGNTGDCTLARIDESNYKFVGEEKDEYSLQEPMIIKKVDKKRKIIIT
tara:strand:+ start:20196 stop:20885 length:690 start_codon:yes stop_codon:yes gene_type:complete